MYKKEIIMITQEQNREFNQQYQNLIEQTKEVLFSVCEKNVDFDANCDYGFINRLSFDFDGTFDFNNSYHLQQMQNFLILCRDSLPSDLSLYIDFDDKTVPINENLEQQIDNFIKNIKNLLEENFIQHLKQSNLTEDLEKILIKLNQHYSNRIDFVKFYNDELLNETEKQILWQNLQDPTLKGEIYEACPIINQLGINHILSQELKSNVSLKI